MTLVQLCLNVNYLQALAGKLNEFFYIRTLFSGLPLECDKRTRLLAINYAWLETVVTTYIRAVDDNYQGMNEVMDEMERLKSRRNKGSIDQINGPG
jgi:hypothetical protein